MERSSLNELVNSAHIIITAQGLTLHCIGMILCCSIQESMTQAMFLLRFLDLCARTGREAGENCRESRKTKRQTVVGQITEVWPLDLDQRLNKPPTPRHLRSLQRHAVLHV